MFAMHASVVGTSGTLFYSVTASESAIRVIDSKLFFYFVNY